MLEFTLSRMLKAQSWGRSSERPAMQKDKIQKAGENAEKKQSDELFALHGAARHAFYLKSIRGSLIVALDVPIAQGDPERKFRLSRIALEGPRLMILCDLRTR